MTNYFTRTILFKQIILNIYNFYNLYYIEQFKLCPSQQILQKINYLIIRIKIMNFKSVYVV